MPRSKKTAIRVLAITMMLAVCALSTQAVGHWHDNPYEEAHCQICHIGHATVPQPALQAEMQAPVPVARFAPTEESPRSLRSTSFPRSAARTT
ncbi:MAG: hypothetical protein ACRD4Q_03440 [Candidatus Acidiferrales bacterium]